MRSSRKTLRVCIAGVAVLATIVMTTGGVAGAANTSPITVGGIWSQTDFKGGDVGAEAAFNAFNAAGGLDGRKIHFIGMQDDASDTTQDLAAAKTMVQDHVFAVLPVLTGEWVGGPVLAKAGIPYFGWGVSPTWWGSSNGFSPTDAVPPTPSTSPIWANQKLILCKAVSGGCKGKTVALLADNQQASIVSMQSDAAQWKATGAKVVAEISSVPNPPAVVTDYSPYTQQLLASNAGGQPDIIEQILPASQSVGVNSELNAEGFKGVDINFTLYDPAAVTVDKSSDTALNFAPWQQTSAAVKLMIKRVQATSSTVALSQSVEIGYISAEMFIAGIKKAGPSVTSKSLIKTLNSGFTFGIPGLIGTQTYPAAHTQNLNCFSVVKSDGVKYSVAVPLSCVARTKNPLHK
jgi:branched-chain amino acid transport system substrate-binding protein